MASRKTKLDLLVKVRYQNPLPAPPCPPKLLEIPTDPHRYARPEFLDSLANDAPLPMIVDGEMGMPLDLGQWEALWADGASDAALNPDPTNKPVLDPKDQALLADPSGSGYSNGDLTPRAAARASAPQTPANVTWLRRTEYLNRDTAALQRTPTQEVLTREERVDVSRDAQLRSIAASFSYANDDFDLSRLQHPTKKNVTAISSYELQPDVSIWANAYDIFRFSERPGERHIEEDDPRLENAVIRPMESDGEHFLSYYLSKTDREAEAHKTARREGDMSLHIGEGDNEGTRFEFKRDYEAVKIEADVNNEFLLVFDEGGEVEVPAPPNGSTVEVRGRGAYFKGIERKMLLKKKRADPRESYTEKWDLVHMLHDPPEGEDLRERSEAMAEVLDPEYSLHADVDAEGEADEDFAVPSTNGVDGHGTQIEVDV
ncbi:Paf1-domain-containing protein [Peniophora sp. CONT]|nr:Paf1-domain-containing protein [Peniophora sp. CONT]